MSCVFGKKSKRKNTNRKLVGACLEEKCVFWMKGKRKNTCRVFLGRKVSGETQNRSLLVCAGKKTGREEKLASGKTHGVGEEGAYVRSTYLGCARRYTTERKRCGDTRGREKQA